MGKTTSTVLLALYFFCYTIPQHIPKVVYVYDRVSIHMLFLAVLNLLSFLVILKKEKDYNILSVFRGNHHAISYLGFIIFSIISLLIADNLIEGLVSITKFFIFFFSFLIILRLSKVKSINFLKTFTLLTLIAVFLESTVINYLFFDSIITNGNFLERGNDFKGLTANINISSFSLCLKIPLLFYIIYNNSKKYIKYFSLFLVYSSITTILLLGGRAPILALSFVLLSVVILSLIKTNKLKLYDLSLSILMVLLSFVTYEISNQKNSSYEVIERFSNISNPMLDQSVSERANYYSTAIQSIKDNPLTGVGVGNWKIISIKLSSDIIEEYRVPYFVHNDFLQITAEIGLFGGLLYIYFIFFPFILSYLMLIKSKEKNFDLYFMIFLIFGVYIIDSLLNFPMDRPVNVIYLLFSIALLYSFNKKMVLNEK